ncbi:MAG: glutaredoxin domain-containing protein [Chthoniobacteraceae bacterium]
METLTLVLVGLGGLLALAGGIMTLVAAFRQNVLWGIACLVLGPASLVFTALHWAEAKKGFLTSLAGVVLAVLGLAMSPTLRAAITQTHGHDPGKLPAAGFALEQATPAPDLNAQIQQQRDQIEQLEGKFAQDGEALVQQFKKLTEKRKALKKGDAATVNAFNAEAADYQARNTARQQASQEIQALRAELDTLLEQRSRRNTGSAAAPGGKRVVMYSTSHCPACKMAKTYFTQKGVPYEEHDIEKSPEDRAAFQKLGGHGVPLIMVGTERMEGFSAQRLDQLL